MHKNKVVRIMIFVHNVKPLLIFAFYLTFAFIILFSLPFPQFSALSSAPCLWFRGKTPWPDNFYANTAYAQTDTGLG
jgi:hypothetical protein